MVTWEVPKHSNRDWRYMSAQISSLKALWIEGAHIKIIDAKFGTVAISI